MAYSSDFIMTILSSFENAQFKAKALFMPVRVIYIFRRDF